METVVWMFGFLLVLGLLMAMADQRSSFLFSSFKSGAQIWSQIFPMAALAIFFYCLLANLLPGNWPFARHLNLMPLFSKAELTVFLLAGSTLFLRTANVVGLVLGFYTVQRLFFSSVFMGDFSIGPAIFVGSIVIIGTMADCYPWIEDSSQKLLGDKLREIMTLAFSFLAMASLFACFLKLGDFTKYLADIDSGFNGQTRYILLTILLLFAGWIVVALGIARHIVIPLVVLPTAMAISFLTSWSPTIVLIFFLTLVLTSLVRRRYLIMTTTRITYM